MRIERHELQTLLDLLGITADRELNCEEFLAFLPAYLEWVKAGASAERATGIQHPVLQQHLSMCPECREEVECLLEAIDARLL